MPTVNYEQAASSKDAVSGCKAARRMTRNSVPYVNMDDGEVFGKGSVWTEKDLDRFFNRAVRAVLKEEKHEPR